MVRNQDSAINCLPSTLPVLLSHSALYLSTAHTAGNGNLQVLHIFPENFMCQDKFLFQVLVSLQQNH